MELYYVVGSPNCRKVHAVIHQLGLNVNFRYLDFFAGHLQQTEFLRMNPNGMVPVLRDGDFVLWESNAIMQYLADVSAGGETLLPRDAKGRADVTRWLCWELAHFNKAFGVLSFETVAKPGFMALPPDEGAVAWAKGELARYAAVLQNHLKDRKFLVGDHVTLADYAMIHVESFKEMVPFDWSPFPAVNAYFDHMRQNPHWQQSAPAGPEAMGRIPKS